MIRYSLVDPHNISRLRKGAGSLVGLGTMAIIAGSIPSDARRISRKTGEPERVVRRRMIARFLRDIAGGLLTGMAYRSLVGSALAARHAIRYGFPVREAIRYGFRSWDRHAPRIPGSPYTTAIGGVFVGRMVRRSRKRKGD